MIVGQHKVEIWRTVGNGNILHACEIDPCLKRLVTVCNMVVTGKPGNWTRLCKTCEKILAGGSNGGTIYSTYFQRRKECRDA